MLAAAQVNFEGEEAPMFTLHVLPISLTNGTDS